MQTSAGVQEIPDLLPGIYEGYAPMSFARVGWGWVPERMLPLFYA